MDTKLRKKNRGMTLIELIVVIAIMGVAIGIGGYSIHAIASTNSKKCASLIQSEMSETRMIAMAKSGSCKLTVYQGTDGIYMQQTGDSSATKIAGSSVTVTLTTSSGDVALGASGSGYELVVEYNKSTGGFISTFDVKKITVTGGGSTHTLTCYKTTGKTELD